MNYLYLEAGGLSVSLVPCILEVSCDPFLFSVHLVASQTLQLPNGLPYKIYSYATSFTRRPREIVERRRLFHECGTYLGLVVEEAGQPGGEGGQVLAPSLHLPLHAQAELCTSLKTSLREKICQFWRDI